MKLIDLDQSAFGDLIEPYRRELQAHCYRMMGTPQDAEDAVQEAFLKAWLRRETLQDVTVLRAWLYKIATNTCLDSLRRQKRRFVPATYQSASSSEHPIPASIHEPIWLEPYPDAVLNLEGDPAGSFDRRESIRMAFIALLHQLPPRQRAVIILRDVVGWKAKDIAEALDTTVLAVKSALRRARLTLDHPRLMVDENALDGFLQNRLERYVQAWENGDTDGLVSLLTDDATFSMPPIPSWYQGRANIHALITKTIFSGDARARWHMQLTRANGQIAFALYRQSEPGIYASYGIQLIEVEGEHIRDITTFRDAGLFRRFGLMDVVTR